MKQEYLIQNISDWSNQVSEVAFYAWGANKKDIVSASELSSWLQLRWGMFHNSIKLMIEMDQEKANGNYWLGGYSLEGKDPFVYPFVRGEVLTVEEINLAETIVKKVFPLIKIIRCNRCDAAVVYDQVDNEWYCSECINNLSAKDRFGYVYLFGSQEKGYYKIGKSIKPDGRLKNYELSKLPFKVSMIHTFPADNMDEAEKAIHKLYRQKRTNGEWFELSARELKKITGIKGYKSGSWI